MTDTCTCGRTADLVARALKGQQPTCTQHNPNQTHPNNDVALNDGESLASLIGAQLTTTQENI
ncbi:hypothetical protein [uncultured Nocardioides sp.]|uniref:hypothetical protein n=1 Tax=uncultured Nocardioides sp. TaxID=198441 RepID=UPI0030F90C92